MPNDTDPTTTALVRAHREAMLITGVKNPERVSIHFDVFQDGPGEPGGPLYTIVVKVPSEDRRRNDSEERGMGETLDAALANLRERVS